MFREIPFRELVEGAPAVFWITDSDKTTVHYVSPSYETVCGRDCDSLYDSLRSFFDSIHPEDRPAALEGSRLQAQGPYELTFRFLHASRGVRWLRTRTYPMGPGGKWIGGMTEDVTDEKVAEDQLRSIVESCPDALVIVDGKGRIVSVNSRSEAMFGYDRQELIGRPVEVLVEPRLQTLHVGLRDAYIRTPGLRPMGSRETDIRACPKTGPPIPVEIGLSPVFTPGAPPVYAASVRDLSEQKQRARELRELAERVANAEMEYRARVSSDLHDLIAQPLAALRLRLHALRREVPEAVGEMEELLGACLGSVRTLASNLAPPLLSEPGLAPALEAAAADILGARIASEVRCLPTQADLDRDRKLFFYQVARELLVNAVKHADPSRVVVSLSVAGEEATLVVEDDGAGMDASDPRASEGLGLLAIRERASFRGGRVTVESSPGRGTRISVTIPIGEEPGPREGR